MSPEYVTKFIPFGKENAVSKRYLMNELGCSGRALRKHIERATEQGAFICNNQDGAGYYQATFEDLEDIYKRYKSERSRAISILKKIKRMRGFLIENGIDVKGSYEKEDLEGQMSFERFFEEPEGQMSFNNMFK